MRPEPVHELHELFDQIVKQFLVQIIVECEGVSEYCHLSVSS